MNDLKRIPGSATRCTMPDIPERAVQTAAEALARRDFGDRTFEGYARAMLQALADAGLVVVSAEDLEDAIDALAEREGVCFGADCSDEHCGRALRLRAALPEGNSHG